MTIKGTVDVIYRDALYDEECFNFDNFQLWVFSKKGLDSWGSVVNPTSCSLNGGSLEVTRTVPLSHFKATKIHQT